MIKTSIITIKTLSFVLLFVASEIKSKEINSAKPALHNVHI